MSQTAEQYCMGALKNAFVFAIGITFMAFAYVDKMRPELPAIPITIATFIVVLALMYMLFLKRADVVILRERRALNRDVVFLGRYLLIKLQSGSPFFEALDDAASGGYGTASRYMKEIVDQMALGMPIEQALGEAADLSPSNEFRQILWQVNTSLRSGVDVTTTLKSIINEMASLQLIEIQRYSRKLSSISLMYMLIAIIVPSLGIVVAVSFASFVNIQFGMLHYIMFLGALIFLQYMFLSVFRSIRPDITV
jgi:pilus assembly protein TadC